MKSIMNNDNIIVFIYKDEIDFDLLVKEKLEIYIKKVILKLKRRYFKNISGFYTVNVYCNKKFGIILEINKDDELDFFPDLLDLKVIVDYDSNMYFKFDDYFIIKNKNILYFDNNYYVSINDISDKDLLLLCEFGVILYGEKLNDVIDDLKLLH